MFAVVVAITGAGLGGLGLFVAVKGTGVSIPTGTHAVEGTIVASELTDSPAGEPFTYGEVKLTKAGSRAMEQSWSAPAGSPSVEIEVTGSSERLSVKLPEPSEWRGPIPSDTLEVDSIEGMPVLGPLAEEARERVQPPYVVIVRALRPGDAIVALQTGRELTDLHVGTRAELNRWLAAQESGRWPVVFLLLVMSVASLLLGYRMRPTS